MLAVSVDLSRSSPHSFLVVIKLYISTPSFFFFNDTATPEIYPLSLHDALPICPTASITDGPMPATAFAASFNPSAERSEEHTSELQSQSNLVCRLLLEKKKTIISWLLNIIGSLARAYAGSCTFSCISSILLFVT